MNSPPTERMSDVEYHRDTSRISKSGLDLIAKSPLHYWQKYMAPDRESEKETPALAFGRAFHHILFEPDYFALKTVIMPEIDRKTAKGKEAYAEFMKASTGKTVISREDYETLNRMRDVFMNHPLARLVLAKGEAEKVVLFNHPAHDAPCKAKLDWLSHSEGFIVDAKTTEDAGPRDFSYSARKYRYHVQSAFYQDGCVYAGIPQQDFLFFAIEKSKPHGLKAYFLPKDAVLEGRSEYLLNLESYMRCRNTNHWPGYSEEVSELPWFTRK